jgi:hypothetical protein
MKFKKTQDREVFLRELKSYDYPTYLSIDEEIEKSFDAQNFITTKRKDFANRLKSFRRSQAQKANWRTSRYKYLKGIREFAKSVEGKQFHRKLSRYLVGRGILKGQRQEKSNVVNNEQFELNRYSLPEFLVALSSLRTHLLIETRYYQSLSDEVDYFILLETLIAKLNNLENRTLESIIDYNSFNFTEDDLLFLEAIVGDVEYQEEEIEE